MVQALEPPYTVTFDRLPGIPTPDINLPPEPIDLKRTGNVKTAITSAARQFGSVNLSTNDLGSLVYAVVRGGNGTLWVTNADFDPREPISRRNQPFTAGDQLPNPESPSETITITDWATDGPTFEDQTGFTVQVETGEITDFFSTQHGGGTLQINPLPRGITESDIVEIGNMLSDQGIPEPVWGPLTIGEFPPEDRFLRQGSEELRVSARARLAAEDYDKAGLFYRLAGLLLQASDRNE